jgi:hypothetical protein
MSMMSSQIRMLTALGNAIADGVEPAEGDETPEARTARLVMTILAGACVAAGEALLAEEMALLATIADKPG